MRTLAGGLAVLCATLSSVPIVARAAAPSLQISPDAVASGQQARVYGRGFCGSSGCSPVTVKVEQQTVASGVGVASDGTFATSFIVNEPPGSYRVTASQSAADGSPITAMAYLGVPVSDTGPTPTSTAPTSAPPAPTPTPSSGTVKLVPTATGTAVTSTGTATPIPSTAATPTPAAVAGHDSTSYPTSTTAPSPSSALALREAGANPGRPWWLLVPVAAVLAAAFILPLLLRRRRQRR